MTSILIACIGNPYVGDDAVGCVIYNRLQRIKLPNTVRVISLELGGLRILDSLEGEQLLIVVDAVQFGSQPGTIHIMNLDTLPRYAGLPVTSHDISLREALELGALLQPHKMPQQVVLIGIEGACFDQYTTTLTKAVENALEDVPRGNSSPGNTEEGKLKIL